MSGPTPRVTVLLPVYNGARHLREAIASVLGQTFTDFELLVVSDGSTDESVAIARSYADPRVSIVDRRENLGLVATLNEGLTRARGEYVARQDADDVLRPTRLATQVRYLDDHHDIAAVGSSVQLLNDDGRSVGVWHYPEDPVAARWALLFNSALAHSSVMFRAARIREAGGYSGRQPHVEDYELWSRLILTDGLASVPEVLQGYRLSEAGVSRQQESRQLAGRRQIARENMARLIRRDVPDDVLQVLLAFEPIGDRARARDALALVISLWTAFLEQHSPSPRSAAAIRDLYFQMLLGLLARVPSPSRHRLVVESLSQLPVHPGFVARLGKLLLKVWA